MFRLLHEHSAQIFVNVKKNETMITCPHCSRILYFKEAISQK